MLIGLWRADRQFPWKPKGTRRGSLAAPIGSASVPKTASSASDANNGLVAALGQAIFGGATARDTRPASSLKETGGTPT